MRLARFRGQEPRLVSIAGRVSLAGSQIQALDSRSGWATLADNERGFILPDVIWYPRASYDLVISTDGASARLVSVALPQEFPEGGLFDIGELSVSQGKPIDLGTLPGIDARTFRDYDAANAGYYQRLFEELTADKVSDEEQIAAICDYVAGKLNYDVTELELGSPRRILESGSQYCGHLSEAMATLLKTGGYEVRTIDLTDGKEPPGTHVVVEVFYGGEWHLYDPTYGVKFLKKDGVVASYKDVRLDTSVITEDVFVRFKPKQRREIAASLFGIYGTGYHHHYYFKDR